MNKFPLWKNLLIVFVIIFSTIYAIPNLFGEDPAVQISGKKGVEVTEQVAQQIQQTLKAQSLDFKAAELEKGQLLIRFDNEQIQMKAQNVIAAYL